MNTGPLYYIHVNLTIVLLLAFIVLIAGLTTANMIPVTNFIFWYLTSVLYLQWLCGVIAGVLHYLFLSVFCWMLAEGVMLLLSVVDLWGTVTKRWYLLLPLGWGKIIINLYH